MSQNIMKFSGANWYAVKTFTKILGISETNGKRIDLPHENIYEFYYALRKLLIGAMLEYEISRLA